MTSRRLLLLCFSAYMLLGALLFLRPHQETFIGLDSSAIRWMTHAMAQGRPQTGVDPTLLQVPAKLRSHFVYMPDNFRLTRDRSFQLDDLRTCAYRPWFYPALSHAALAFDRIIPGHVVDYFLPSLALVFFIFCGWFMLSKAGLPGLVTSLGLSLSLPLLFWFSRGYYPEMAGLLLMAMTGLHWLHGPARPAPGGLPLASRFHQRLRLPDSVPGRTPGRCPGRRPPGPPNPCPPRGQMGYRGHLRLDGLEAKPANAKSIAKPRVAPDDIMARIGISAVALEPHRTGGAETYIRQLLRCPAFHHALRRHEVLVFTGQTIDPALENCGLRLVRATVDPACRNHRLLWEQYAFPGLLRRHDIDLVHFPYSGFPWACRTPFVVTIHDTTNFVMPGSVSLPERVYRRILQRRLPKIDHGHVITVSDADRTVFLRHVPLDARRCTTVHHGRSPDFTCPEPLLGQPRPDGDLIWFGRPYHHKNIDLLPRMMPHLYALLDQASLRSRPKLRLVGLDAEEQRRALALGQSLSITSHITVEPPVPHERLPDYLRKARLLIFPSTYESFGLPALEAMSSGTPVVCSDIPVFRELFADAAIYADPSRPEDFARACFGLLSVPESWHSQAVLGFHRAQVYTWARCAEETAAVYERIAWSI